MPKDSWSLCASASTRTLSDRSFKSVGIMPKKRLAKQERVYVDAKILNMHDQKLKRSAYVSYFVKSTGQHREKQASATESDDAEIEAILFAVENLHDRFRRMVIVCDHQSVVSEAKREKVKKPSALLTRLREVLEENPHVELEVLESNPAHGTLTSYVNALKE